MPQQTLNAYNDFASEYDESVSDFWDEFPTKSLEQFVGLLPKGATVLDLGSGSGRAALLLRQHGLNVICADGAEKMVAITRRLGFESHQARFSIPDLHKIIKEPFDGVWAYCSLIHIPHSKAREIVEYMRSHLKPGGAFMLGTIQGTGSQLREHSIMPNTARHFYFYNKKEAEELVSSFGFTLHFQEDYPRYGDIFMNHLFRLDE